MYCRKCHYDLRGQTVERCPECGTAFEFRDSSTYLKDTQSRFFRHLAQIEDYVARRWIWLGMLLVPYLFIVAMFTPSPHYDGVRCTHVFIRSNLQWALREWEIQRQNNPETTDFDLRAAVSNLPRRGTKNDLIRYGLRRVSRHGANWLVLPCLGYVLGLTWAYRERRTRAVLMGAIALMFLGTYVFLQLAHHPSKSKGAGYDWIHDYVFVDGLNWKAPEDVKARTIAAYERTSWLGKYRYIAFMDGSVSGLSERRAQEILADQGLEHEPPEPMAIP
jgi:hypothetical protein